MPSPRRKTTRSTRLADKQHAEVEAAWDIYQRMVTAYREPDRELGKFLMHQLIGSLASGVPALLVEVRKLGRTLKKRAADVLAHFDRPGTSNWPTEAINGCLEHLRGSALGFRNLANCIGRSLLECQRIHTPPAPSFTISRIYIPVSGHYSQLGGSFEHVAWNTSTPGTQSIFRLDGFRRVE